MLTWNRADRSLTYSQLVVNKGAKNMQLGKYSLSNK